MQSGYSLVNIRRVLGYAHQLRSTLQYEVCLVISGFVTRENLHIHKRHPVVAHDALAVEQVFV